MESELNIAEICYENGVVQFRYSRYLSEDKTRWIRHGLFCSYYEDGSLESEGQYLNDKEEGLWKTYHHNGVKASEGYYKQGEEVGMWKYWGEDGQ